MNPPAYKAAVTEPMFWVFLILKVKIQLEYSGVVRKLHNPTIPPAHIPDIFPVLIQFTKLKPISIFPNVGMSVLPIIPPAIPAERIVVLFVQSSAEAKRTVPQIPPI